MSDEWKAVKRPDANTWNVYESEHHLVAEVLWSDDARLIAAAPQLLDACERALGLLWEEQARLDSPTPFDRTVEQIEAAIRAAREG